MYLFSMQFIQDIISFNTYMLSPKNKACNFIKYNDINLFMYLYTDGEMDYVEVYHFPFRCVCVAPRNPKTRKNRKSACIVRIQNVYIYFNDIYLHNYLPTIHNESGIF